MNLKLVLMTLESLLGAATLGPPGSVIRIVAERCIPFHAQPSEVEATLDCMSSMEARRVTFLQARKFAVF